MDSKIDHKDRYVLLAASLKVLIQDLLEFIDRNPEVNDDPSLLEAGRVCKSMSEMIRQGMDSCEQTVVIPNSKGSNKLN